MATGDSPWQRPNILFIESDQHNAFVTGCYGDPVIQTPNLDGLAARGVVLDAAYCASPICVPSRMSFLTGRYPHENEVWTNKHILDSAIPTYAHAMGAAGYRPVQIGRMHYNGLDQLHGFAERLVGDHSPNFVGSPRPPFGPLEGTTAPLRLSLEKSGYGQSAYQVHDEDVTAATVDYLNRLGVGKRAGQDVEPFSLSVGLTLPHHPFVARKEDYDLYAGSVTMPRTPERFSDNLHPYFQWWWKRTGLQQEIDDEMVLRCRIAYWALVARMDAMIGEMLDALERNGLSENTLVIYTSDHGEQVGEHGLWWKQTFYEDSARVPVIISWPGVLPEGVRSDRVVSQLDINSTMLDAIGAPPLPRSHGRSLLDLLKDPDGTPWEDLAFSEYCTDIQVEGGPYDVHAGPSGWYHRMIRRDRWKLNYYHGMEPQLFNLAEDPRETRDLARDSGHGSIRRDLLGQLLDSWDPDVVASKMADIYRDQEILQSWARNVDPTDTIRWDLRPEMNYLDGP